MVGVISLLTLVAGPGEVVTGAAGTPIQHVVIIYQENHTFDNVLGRLCVLDSRCDGANSGKISTGATIPLSTATDVIPNVAHSVYSQNVAIDSGLMDHFDLIKGCNAPAYACMSQYDPSQIPNLAALARKFAISDATFQLSQDPSWGSHLELVTSTPDGFTGDNPQAPAPPGTVFGPGWGCDSHRYAWWVPPTGGSPQSVPACVPFPDGTGAVAPTPVKWVPTLMDRLHQVGLTYRLYAGSAPSVTSQAFQRSGYQWAICPTFADCVNTVQKSHMVHADQVITDAESGLLPAVSVVTPIAYKSQHNGYSMLSGDNWLGSVVRAIEHGPDWASTAIFISYDDCGCFYDHVSPPAGLGPRIPVVIVSPYAISGHTDSKIATQASFLAFIEHNFGLAPLGLKDSAAYDFSGSFNYSQPPLAPVGLTTSATPASSLDLPIADPNDPT
jgi:phospholipase C